MLLDLLCHFGMHSRRHLGSEFFGTALLLEGLIRFKVLRIPRRRKGDSEEEEEEEVEEVEEVEE